MPLKEYKECPECPSARFFTTQKYSGDATRFVLQQHIVDRRFTLGGGNIPNSNASEYVHDVTVTAHYGSFDVVEGGKNELANFDDVRDTPANEIITLVCLRDRFCLDEEARSRPAPPEGLEGGQYKKFSIRFCDSAMRDFAIQAIRWLSKSDPLPHNHSERPEPS